MNIETNRYELDINYLLERQTYEEELSQLAIYFLNNDIFSCDPHEFHESISKSRHPLMLTPYTVEDFSQMRTYKLVYFDIGFALIDRFDDCEIVGVHNNESLINSVGTAIVEAAIRHGGNCLNHFGSEKLNKLYSSLGFVEMERKTFDARYDPDNRFKNKYGTLPIIYRALNKT